MKNIQLSILSLCLVLFCTCTQGQDKAQQWMKSADIVVVATVQESNAASFKGVPVNKLTAVVVVNQVVKKAGTISLKKGDKMTIQLLAEMKPGSTALFYTQGWILGAGVAVKEIGHEGVKNPDGEAGAIQKRVNEQERAETERQLKTEIEKADLVALGSVQSVRVLKPRTTIDSEHNPEWAEAVIQIEDGVKGSQQGQTIIVRFPASMDIHYNGVPKPQKGQRQVFLLKRDLKISGYPSRGRANGRPVLTYVITDPANVMDSKSLDQVKRVGG